MINSETIKVLRKKDWTLKEIGSKFGVTGERIRQILDKKKPQYCRRHGLQFMTKCKYCYNETHYKALLQSNIRKHNLEEEIMRLSKRDRRGETIVQRKLLIKKLHDELHMSFCAIGRLLKRHHSTIIWLYRN